MPWRVGTMSELRLSFVQEVLELKQPVTACCRKYRISRKTGHKWLKRYRSSQAEALSDHSRRPRSSPGRTATGLEEKILQVRDAFGWWAPKIWAYLRNRSRGPGAELTCPASVRWEIF